MCFNCNCGKSLNDGICPHKKINRSLFPFEDERYGSKALLNKNTKINWPSDEELINMCNESSINSVKGKLNVCYNTIVKRLKRRNKFHLVKLRKTRPKSKPNLSL